MRLQNVSTASLVAVPSALPPGGLRGNDEFPDEAAGGSELHEVVGETIENAQDSTDISELFDEAVRD